MRFKNSAKNKKRQVFKVFYQMEDDLLFGKIIVILCINK